jgi:uncharacterized protein (DUF2147 family)
VKKLFLFIFLAIGIVCPAQNSLNLKADNIVGTYKGRQGDDQFRAKVEKMKDGTYRCQVIWLEHSTDAKGHKLLDTKNPEKKLRNNPLDRVVLFSGLEYNKKEKRWDGCKIYDPQRGIRANLKAEFMEDGRLRLKGSLLGISESVYWTKE